MQVQESLGVPIVHETHRQRLLMSPYQTAELLAHPELHGKLRINADLSHWCCVCEHVFDSSDPRDDWWPKALALVAAHCGLVHCRVGHAEGPQVAEPDAPEVASEVKAHCGWWREIWEAAACRGEAAVWAEPEHGPPPYLQTLPYSQKPVAELWDVNTRVAARVRAEFGDAMARVQAEVAKEAGAKDAAKVAAEAKAKADKEAARAKAARDKLLAKVVKEGGKKGVEIEGASDMGGLDFFCTTVESPDGDVDLLHTAMAAMNAQPDPNAEDRKGCSGHVGKMIFSAGVHQLALVAYVPADKAETVAVVEWVAYVLGVVGGKVMASPVAPADSPQGGSVVQAIVGGDADNGKFPLKDKDAAMAAAFAFLRQKGAFPEDDDDDDDEMIFGDDDNLDDYE